MSVGGGVNVGTAEGTLRLVDQFTGPLRAAANGVTSFASSAKRLLGQLGISISAAAIAHAIYENTAQAQAAMAQLRAGVKSTGGAAGLAAEEIADMAGELQRMSAIEDETIMNAQAILLTFTKIGKEAFQPATVAALDLSRRLGNDLAGAATMVGKALNDPILGLTALSKAGIQFNESQKATIKSLVEVGDVATAQKIILKELETQVGGSAAAFRDTLPGAIQALGNAWGDLLEEIGQSGGEGGGLFRTAIEGMVNGLNYLKDNWYALEAAIFETLGDVANFIAKFVAFTLTQWEAAARGARLMFKAMTFGLGDTSQFDRFINGLVDVKKEVVTVGAELKQGFGIKAAAAIDAGIAPTKKLGDELKRTGDKGTAAAEKIAEAFKKARAAAAVGAQAVDMIVKGKPSAEVEALVKAAMELGSTNLLDPIVQDLARLNLEAAESEKAFNAISAAKKKVLQTITPSGFKGGVLGVNPETIKTTSSVVADLAKRIAEAKSALTVDPSKYGSWEDYQAAVDKATESLENHRQVLAAIASGATPEVIATIKAMQKELGELNKKQAEAIKKASGGSDFKTQLIGAAQGIEAAFNSVDSVVGRVGATIARMVQSLASAKGNTEKWGVALMAASDIAQQFAPKTTSGGFGGKGATNYAGIGSVVGSVIGAVLAAVFTWGMGTSGGAAIGSAIGGAVGSFIVSGADEALGKIEWGASSVGMTFSTMVSKSEAGLGIVLEELGNSIDRQIKGLMAAIGGTIASAAAMDVKVRDGVISVFVAGVVGRFRSMDEAVSFAVTELLKNSNIIGLSDTIKQILSTTTATSLDDLSADLDFGMWFDSLKIGEVGQRLMTAMADLRVKLMRAAELGLDIGPIVQDSFKQFQGFKEQLLGINTSTANAIAALDSYQKGVVAVSDQLSNGLAQAQAALANALNVQATSSGADKFTEEIGRIIASIPGLQAAVASYMAQLEAIPKALTDQEINMGIFDALYVYLKDNKKYAADAAKYAKFKVEMEFAAIKAQLIAMNKWEEFAAMFNDAYAAALKLAGKAGRPGRSGTSAKDEVRNFIDDKKFDLATSSMGVYAKRLADIGREYDEQIKKAGKDVELKKKLLDLKEQELKLLGEEIRRNLIKPYQGGKTDGNRSDFMRQFEDIRKAYDDARAVAAATGVSIRDLNRAERERLHLLGLQASAAAGSRTAQTVLEMQNLGQTIDFLRDNAKKLGVDFNKLMRELQSEQFLSFGDKLMGFIDRYYSGVAGFDEFRIKLEQTRFELELGNMRLQFSLLKSLGLLTDEAVKSIEGVLGWISENEPDWDAIIGAGGAADVLSNSMNGASDSSNSLRDAFLSAREGIKKFIDDTSRGSMGLVSPRAAYAAALEQYNETMASARSGQLSGLQAAPEAARNLIEAMKAFSPILAATQLPNVQNEMRGLLSINTVRDGNVTYTERFVQQQAVTNSTLAQGFSNMSSQTSESLRLQASTISELKKLNASQAELSDRLAASKLSDITNKRGVA